MNMNIYRGDKYNGNRNDREKIQCRNGCWLIGILEKVQILRKSGE